MPQTVRCSFSLHAGQRLAIHNENRVLAVRSPTFAVRVFLPTFSSDTRPTRRDRSRPPRNEEATSRPFSSTCNELSPAPETSTSASPPVTISEGPDRTERSSCCSAQPVATAKQRIVAAIRIAAALHVPKRSRPDRQQWNVSYRHRGFGDLLVSVRLQPTAEQLPAVELAAGAVGRPGLRGNENGTLLGTWKEHTSGASRDRRAVACGASLVSVWHVPLQPWIMEAQQPSPRLQLQPQRLAPVPASRSLSTTGSRSSCSFKTICGLIKSCLRS